MRSVEAQARLGRAVRVARIEQGSSQEQLAASAGLDRTYVSGMERGTRNPTLATVERLAAALGMTAAELLALADRLDGDG